MILYNNTGIAHNHNTNNKSSVLSTPTIQSYIRIGTTPLYSHCRTCGDSRNGHAQMRLKRDYVRGS